MVIDFTEKKIVKEEIVDEFDHATVLTMKPHRMQLAHELKKIAAHHVILVDYQQRRTVRPQKRHRQLSCHGRAM
jgi:6-pyruvoyltetrahydropterin/6-carboxytetrahydropterin synthase